MSAFLALVPMLVSQSQAAAQVPFLAPLAVAETNRLALTPTIDGEIQPGEWEKLADTTYFQWEPDTLYFAAQAKLGQDIVVSIDHAGDGWLVGDDNVELRCHLAEGKLKVTLRRLDATNPNGPKWIPAAVPTETLKFSAKVNGDTWSMEAAYDADEKGDPIKEGKKFGLRIDLAPEDMELDKPYLPRTMTFVRLQYDNSTDLFSGLSWRPNIPNRSFAREDEFRIRYEFHVDPEGPSIKNFEVEGSGRAASVLTKIRNPFPVPDAKGRARVDYVTRVAPGASPGYRIVKGTLTTADGREAVVRTSVRIADLVDIDPNFPMELKASDDAQIIRGGVTYKSQATGRISGTHTMTVPTGWTASRGGQANLLVYHTRGQQRVSLEFIVPRGTKGTFPVKFEAQIGDRTITKTVYVHVR
ncbi:MAG: hypothetical protein JSS65_00865 [Armatimonadetes bacterium]|nr:hypothetical protein [Armatimonadota bacterium]